MIILYDGVCLLCNRFVQFVVQRTSPSDCRLAPLQDFPTLAARQDSVWVCTSTGEWLSESDAVLYIVRHLRGWRWVQVGRVVPKSWRDAIYRYVARHRYGWFGQSDICLYPEAGRMLTPEEIQKLRHQQIGSLA